MGADLTVFELRAGERLGRYLVGERLGGGAMGVVYAASSGPPTFEVVALKLMHPRAAESPQLVRRFLREARALAALDHPNIVRVIDTFEHEGRPVIAMERLAGRPLSAVLAEAGKLGVEETATLFVRVVSAVGTAHAAGLVHRDLKPENVFVLDAAPFVKVLDFGVAKLSKDGPVPATSPLTHVGQLIGTPFYMAPEQAFGEENVDHRADMFSLALMMFECLTGVLPTRADSLREVLERLIAARFPRASTLEPRVPEGISTLLAEMLAGDPAARPRDLRVVYEVLLGYAKPAARSDSRPFAPATVPPPASRERTEPEPLATNDPPLSRLDFAPAPLPQRGTSIATAPAVTADPLQRTADENARTLDDPGARAGVAPSARRRPTTPWPWYAAAAVAVLALALLLVLVAR